MTLRDLFNLSLINRRDEVALEWQGTEYTFGEIDHRSDLMAAALSEHGLIPGDRVCVQLANCIEIIDIYLACIKTGIIFVPVNILYRDREVQHILTDAEPKLFITTQNIPILSGAGSRPALLDGDTPAALVYTSGTTGTSKGAILTHNNFASNALNLLTCWQITNQDRFLLALPLFHVHALGNGLHCWLISGCRMRLLERFDHQTAAEQFLNFRPTLFFGVPTIYVRLLETPPATAKQIGKDMRLFVSGSAPLPAHVMEEFRNLFGHTILERYGMTETIMNISNPYVGERRPGSVGLPLPGVSVKLSDTGEVLLKGPNVFAGYWKRDDATREAFVDGWFKTGDIATRSDDGYYTLSGRKSDLIISGGFNIYPREIEEFLMEQPEIVEAAVVGEPDRLRGEIPVAYIVVREPIDPDVLIDRCKANLSSFKVPRKLLTIDLLPRNALGKVQKHLLCPAS
ncbi:MAG TPA: AMP-binding protein [Bryobacteraceae bacterium]|jgi:malonyl-CoA/methylmalonyl-CoA synthetase|nr:AMP-binding protein [Bryobacteraceae bacterium]